MSKLKGELGHNSFINVENVEKVVLETAENGMLGIVELNLKVMASRHPPCGHGGFESMNMMTMS